MWIYFFNQIVNCVLSNKLLHYLPVFPLKVQVPTAVPAILSSFYASMSTVGYVWILQFQTNIVLHILNYTMDHKVGRMSAEPEEVSSNRERKIEIFLFADSTQGGGVYECVGYTGRYT